jgi:hypothetical protein
MCAASGVIPASCNNGTTVATIVIYTADAVSPVPKIRASRPPINNTGIKFPLVSFSIACEISKLIPVASIQAIRMPAKAHVAAIPPTSLPAEIAHFINLRGVIAVSLLSQDRRIKVPMAQFMVKMIE